MVDKEPTVARESGRSSFSRFRRMDDDSAVRCTECKQEADEFTAIGKGWRYWSDGTSLLPYCPECAKREFARPTLPRAG